MTENIAIGDVMQMYDTHSTKRTGGALCTILGIIGVIIVLALIWNAFVKTRDERAKEDSMTASSLGCLTSAVKCSQEEIKTLQCYERQDALKLAYTDGALFAGGGYYGGYYGHGRRHHEHDNCRHDNCGQHQQFREVRKFAETSDDIEVINTCGSLRG